MTEIQQVRERLERYEAFLARDSTNVNLYAEVAQLRMQVGDFTAARAALDRALELSPGNAALLSQQAVVAIAAGKPGEAVELLEGLIATGVDAPAVRYNLAYAFMYTGRFDEARRQFETIMHSPDAPSDTLVLLARTLHHLGDLDEAKRYLQQYLEKNPRDPKALGALALISLDLEDVSTARSTAEKAIELDGENLEGLVTLGSLALEGQDSSEAEKYFNLALAKHPKSGRAWGGLGLAEMLAMRPDKAIADLEQGVTYMSSHIGTWHALAWARLVTNDLAGAEAALTKSLEIDRNFGETHGGLAVVAVLQGRTSEAERLAKVALRLDPQSFAGRFAQSLLLASKGDRSAAQEAVQKILSSPIGEGKDSLNLRLAQLARRRAAGDQRSASLLKGSTDRT